jgi:hypothetical protein
LATCNVISLHRPGALAKLKDELNKYGVAIAAVQEIRWCGCEIFESRYFTVCDGGGKDRRQFGTGFLIHKKYKHLILDFSPVTDIICSLLIKGKFFNTTIICTHASTEEKNEVQKDACYENLERMCVCVYI